MTHHTISGGGGVRLHVVENGKADGRPILFIHGTSQCWLQWSRQLSSSLAESHRLVRPIGAIPVVRELFISGVLGVYRRVAR